MSNILASVYNNKLKHFISGEAVPVEEQQKSKEMKNAEATPTIDSLAPPPQPLCDTEKTQYEELINDLYQQLDDKVHPTKDNSINIRMWFHYARQFLTRTFFPVS